MKNRNKQTTEVKVEEPVVTQEETTTETTQTEPVAEESNEKQPEAPVEETKVDETIKTEPSVAKETPSAISTKATIENTKPGVTDPFQLKVIDIQKNGTELQKTLLVTLLKYADKMNPLKPAMPGDDGARMQKELWGSVKHLIEGNHLASDKEFKDAWNLLVEFFKEHNHKKGVFHEMYINRFIDNKIWHNQTEALTFTRIMDVIRATADGTKNLISIDRATANGITEEGRQRLVKLYAK